MANQFLNPGFETTGLTNWTLAGTNSATKITNVTTATFSPVTYTAKVGSRFCRMSDDVKSNLTGQTLSQSRALLAGEIVTAWYAFIWLSAKSNSVWRHEYATITIKQGSTVIATPVDIDSYRDNIPDNDRGPWKRFMWVVPSSGTYTVEFKIWHTSSNSVGGHLLVDALTVLDAGQWFLDSSTSIPVSSNLYPTREQFYNKSFELGSGSGWVLESPQWTSESPFLSGELSYSTPQTSASLTVDFYTPSTPIVTYTPKSGAYLGYFSSGMGTYVATEATRRLWQTGYLSAGQVISWWQAFVWQGAGAAYVENLSVKIKQLGVVVDTVLTWDTLTAGVADYYAGPWELLSWSAPSSGMYTIEFELSHPSADATGSTLLVDGLYITDANTFPLQPFEGTAINVTPSLPAVHSNFYNPGFENWKPLGWEKLYPSQIGALPGPVSYFESYYRGSYFERLLPKSGANFLQLHDQNGSLPDGTTFVRQTVTVPVGKAISGWFTCGDTTHAAGTAEIVIKQGSTVVATLFSYHCTPEPVRLYIFRWLIAKHWFPFYWVSPATDTYTLEFRIIRDVPDDSNGTYIHLFADDVKISDPFFPESITVVKVNSAHSFAYVETIQFLNGGFETGTSSGWFKSGSGTATYNNTSYVGSLQTYSPVAGTYFARIADANYTGTTGTTLESQTKLLLAGQIVTGWYAFRWAKASVDGAVLITIEEVYTEGIEVVSVNTSAESTFPVEYPWTQFSWTVPADGLYTVYYKLYQFSPTTATGGQLLVDELVVFPPMGTTTITVSPTLAQLHVPNLPTLAMSTEISVFSSLTPRVTSREVSTLLWVLSALSPTWVPHPTYTFSIPVQFSVLPINLRPSIDIVFRVFETYSPEIGVVFDVTVTAYSPTIPVSFVVYETYQPTITTRITVFPTFTDGIGAQGVGGQVVLTTASGGTGAVPYAPPSAPPMAEPEVPLSIEGLAISWRLSVSLNGIDISARLTGGVSIDQEESAAAVAVFSIRPADGSVDPYTWIKAPVTIDYVETDSAGIPIYAIRMFSGIVDTPAYNVMTRVCQFTCTDNLQNVISNMSRDTLAALTPLAQWSKYVYNEESSGWDYLQQRLETYPYTVHLDTNSQVTVKDWRAGVISLEFTEGAIVDQSLSVSLANARDLTNQVTASLGFQQDIYRENVLRLSWFEEMWLSAGAGFNGSPKATPQMISDAVSAAGAVFVEDPWWQIQPESGWLTQGSKYVGFLNWGDELLAQGFKALVAKRHKQSVKNVARVTVQSSASIEAIGFARDEKSGTIAVEYTGSLDEAFFASNEVTRFVCTAGPSMTQGKVTDNTYGNTRYGTFGNAYPNLPVKFQKAGDGQQYFGSPFDLADYGHLLDSNNSYNTLTGLASGHLLPGQHVYDFDSFVARGNKAERAAALAVVMAQSSRTILASHRQNRVGFTTLLRPTLNRGDTVRVDTDPIKATGVVYQIVHNFNIDNGSALTSATLALSSAKSVGIRPVASVTFRPEIRVTINVLPVTAKITEVIDQVKLVGPHGALVNGVVKTPATEFLSSINLESNIHTGTVNPSWTGHITPSASGTFKNKEHAFVIDFPNIPIATTENADIVVYGDTIEVNIPQDELFLLA